MPISSAALEERLQRMAKNARAVNEASRAIKDAAAQAESVAAPQPISITAPPLAPVTKK